MATANHKNHQAHEGHAVGNVSSYIVGFILSILLTVIPYFLVVHHLIHQQFMLIASIVILGIMQLLVQLIFFLHLGSETKPRWNLMAFVFTIIVVVILVSGSIWIMYNLEYNMMP